MCGMGHVRKGSADISVVFGFVKKYSAAWTAGPMNGQMNHQPRFLTLSSQILDGRCFLQNFCTKTIWRDQIFEKSKKKNFRFYRLSIDLLVPLIQFS